MNSYLQHPAPNTQHPHYILTLSCPDAPGIVAAVSGFLFEHHGFIIESAQFGDPSTRQFFMRVEFTLGFIPLEGGGSRRGAVASSISSIIKEDGDPLLASPFQGEEEFKQCFQDMVATRFGMDWQLHNKARRARMLVLVSKYSHCLSDLLHRVEAGTLHAEIPAVVSNHDTLRHMVERHGIPFYRLPIDDKAGQEAQIADLFVQNHADVLVLARYMQILSPETCARFSGQAINIHHSFLPSFIGANPYHRAYDRGVKLIGATAHYVTTDLDEGPIIEQEVNRVDHTQDPDELTAIGRDIECIVLARALKYHIEHRVLLNGVKTVVFK